MHQRYIAEENIVRKGEIVCNKQFLLFSQCFLPYMVLIFLFQPFPKRQILDFSKLKEFADDNENRGKFSERIENTVGKEEITCYEQFLLFPQCFQKPCTADT